MTPENFIIFPARFGRMHQTLTDDQGAGWDVFEHMTTREAMACLREIERRKKQDILLEAARSAPIDNRKD